MIDKIKDMLTRKMNKALVSNGISQMAPIYCELHLINKLK